MEYLDWCNRKDSQPKKFSAKKIQNISHRDQNNVSQTGIVEYFQDAAIPEKITGSASCIIAVMMVHVITHRIFRIDLILIQSTDIEMKCV